MQCCNKKTDAVAQILGSFEAPQLSGCIRFYQEKGQVLIVAHICGLPQNSETGFFGFHIHEGESCSGVSFSETRSHYSPTSMPHPKHAGDMPPLMLCGNVAHLSFLTDRFKGKDILGRTVVIHNMPDDFTSQPSGNSGQKIACGTIKTPWNSRRFGFMIFKPNNRNRVCLKKKT